MGMFDKIKDKATHAAGDRGDQVEAGFDKLKDVGEGIKGKAGEFAGTHGDQIGEGIEKAGGAVNKVTGGRFEDTIDKATSKAKEGVDKLGSGGDAEGTDGPVSPGGDAEGTDGPVSPGGDAEGTDGPGSPDGPDGEPTP